VKNAHEETRNFDAGRGGDPNRVGQTLSKKKSKERVWGGAKLGSACADLLFGIGSPQRKFSLRKKRKGLVSAVSIEKHHN